MNRVFLFVVLLSFAYPFGTFAQEHKGEVSKPKTRLEALERQVGTVVIKGYSTVGEVADLGTIRVESREFIDPTTDDKQLGIVIDVISSGRYERENRSFIDYDEIDPLLKGIDYVLKVDGSSTKLNNFEAIYQTKGDLRVTTFSSYRSSKGRISAAVKSGMLGGATAFISTDKLMELRSLIAEAKQQLDLIK